MASTSVGSIQIDFTANIKKLLTATEKVDKRLQRLQKSATKTKNQIANFAKAAIGVYALSRAFNFAIVGSLKFNQQMEDAEVKLRAMIESASSFEAVSGRIVSAQERQNIVTQETVYTMGLLKKINAETAFGMGDLITSYSLMKPAMDRSNVSIDDQIKLLKLVSNTATTFGLSNQELSTGIDDLASGTYRTTQSFGKMMKAIGVSREEIKNTTDLVGYLSKKMEATGKAQDTMTVAVSNFQVAFDTLRGKLTEGIFDQLKHDLKVFTKQMNTTSPEAMQVFADAIVDMANTGINAIAALTLSITGLISLMQTVWSGYQKLAGLIGGGVSSSALEQRKKDLLELQRIQKEKDYGWFTNQNEHIVNNAIKEQKKAIKEIIADQKYWNNLRAEGDKQVEATAQKQKALTDSTFQAAATLHLEYTDIKKATEATEKAQVQLKRNVTNTVKETQKHNKELKKTKTTIDKIAQSFGDIFNQGFENILKGDFAGGLADIVSNAMQKATSNLSSALSTGLSNLFSGNGSFSDAFKSLGSLDFLGSAVSLLGGLMSNTLSQDAINKAAGVGSFDTHALTDIKTTLEDYQAPQLTATRAMLKHLESMDKDFGSIANALSSATGFNYDGSDYQASASSNWWGGESQELIGSGLKFGEQTIQSFLQGVDVAGYQAEKVTKSSFFGLVNKESIEETSIEVDPKVKKDLARALNSSIDAVLEATTILGFDSSAIKKQLDDFALDLGKVNFKDLNAEEKAQALSDAFSGQLNAAFEASMDPERINELANVGEEYTATLIRLATQQEVVTKQLQLFGQTVEDFAASDALVQASGGLDKFMSYMSTFVERYFTLDEQQAFLEQQLQYALAVYDVSLPASKEQYKALLLETQAKLLNVQTQIDARKAEIRAMIESGKFQEQYTNNMIQGYDVAAQAQDAAGKAAIAYGENVHRSIEAMTTGQAQAVTFDAEVGTFTVDWESFGDSALNNLEAEKEKLSGLYGTLLSNVSQSADYYDGIDAAAGRANDALTKLEESLLAISNLKAVWSGDDISSKKIILDATKRITGLQDLTYENFLDKFEALTADGLGLDDKTLQAWSQMSSALRSYNDAQAVSIKKDITFYENILSQIESAYTGSLSYLNSLEKLDYLSSLNGDNNTINSLQEQLSLEKKLSVTKEDYAVKFDEYIQELKNQEPEKTTDDVVNSIKALTQEVQNIKESIQESTYQRIGA